MPPYSTKSNNTTNSYQYTIICKDILKRIISRPNRSKVRTMHSSRCMPFSWTKLHNAAKVNYVADILCCKQHLERKIRNILQSDLELYSRTCLQKQVQESISFDNQTSYLYRSRWRSCGHRLQKSGFDIGAHKVAIKPRYSPPSDGCQVPQTAKYTKTLHQQLFHNKYDGLTLSSSSSSSPSSSASTITS